MVCIFYGNIYRYFCRYMFNGFIDWRYEMEKLKPCPFCGGEAEMFFNNVTRDYSICCYDVYNDYDCCGAEIASYIDEKELIEMWNQRI